jgi:hypothetical protein
MHAICHAVRLPPFQRVVPGSNIFQSTRGCWWTKRKSDNFLSKYFLFFCYLIPPLFLTDTMQSSPFDSIVKWHTPKVSCFRCMEWKGSCVCLSTLREVSALKQMKEFILNSSLQVYATISCIKLILVHYWRSQALLERSNWPSANFSWNYYL